MNSVRTTPEPTPARPASTDRASAPAVEVVEFGHMHIAFDERVLRPRPWTAAQSAWAAELMTTAPSGKVLELCAGAGHIGLLSVSGSDRQLVCVDLDPVAVSYARYNACVAGLEERVEVREGRLEEVVGAEEQFAMIIADPPWVPHAETSRYPEDPLLAIDGGDDGLDVVFSCLALIESHLAPGSTALLQLGTMEQVDRASKWARRRALIRATEARVFPDRGVLARFDPTAGSRELEPRETLR